MADSPFVRNGCGKRGAFVGCFQCQIHTFQLGNQLILGSPLCMTSPANSQLVSAPDKFRAAVKGQNKLVNFLAILAVPTGLAVWLGVASAESVGWVWFWGVLAVLIVLQIVLYFVSTKYSETVPALHLNVEQLEGEYTEAQRNLNESSMQVEWLKTANRLGTFWSTFQGMIQETSPASDEAFSDSCRIAMTPMIEAAGILFNFGYDDTWSICIYALDTETDLLVPVWHKRSEEHPSEGRPRSWQRGDGHVGSAFMQNRILFTVDMADTDASMLLQPSAENSRDYDSDVYRSFVSAPITLDLATGPAQYGVLVITSNVTGRFGTHNKSIVGRAAQVLAHLFDWRSRLQPES